MSFITSSLIKSFVGFDSLFDEINKVSELKEPNYPPYNLEKLGLEKYKITIAVAGFSIDQLSVEVLGSSPKITYFGLLNPAIFSLQN